MQDVINMKIVHYIFALKLSASLAAIASLSMVGFSADEMQAMPEAGDSWIRNSHLCVRMETSREPMLRWSITCERRNSANGEWIRAFSGNLCGNFIGDKATSRRQRYKCFYPFQSIQEAKQPDLAIENLKTGIEGGSAYMSFRVGKDDLWCDAKVTVLDDTPFVLFESDGQSHPDIRPHWQLNLVSEKPMLKLISDPPSTSVAPCEVDAKTYGGNHIFTSSSRYCAAYRPDDDIFFVLAWPELEKKEKRRIQWLRSNGLSNLYLDAPFAVWPASMACDKDPHTMAHLAEGAHSQVRQMLIEEKK